MQWRKLKMHTNQSTRLNLSQKRLEHSSKRTLVKLQRLKFEECLMLQSLTKYHEHDEVSLRELNIQYNQYISKIVTNFTQIKQLFDNIKANATHEDNLKVLDIEDMKKDVLEMEDKIKSFKVWLQSESALLKQLELEVMKALSDNTSVDAKLKKTKLTSKTYENIVPSPVKRIIQSPFVHSEVQEFQKFMQNSKNRYGGWIPYNHDIFVRCWQKFYTDLDVLDGDSIEKLTNYHQFSQDIKKKITGVTKKDIDEHSKWFLQFLYLKKNQQLALDRWKTMKDLIKNRNCSNQSSISVNKEKAKSENHNDKVEDSMLKKTGRKSEKESLHGKFRKFIMEANERKNDFATADSPSTSSLRTESKKSNFSSESEEFNDKSGSSASSSTFLNPTEQWLRRCAEVKENQPIIFFALDNISKLRIPNWRIDI